MKKSDFKEGDIITLELNDGNFFVIKNCKEDAYGNKWIISKGKRAMESSLGSQAGIFSDTYSNSLYRYTTYEEKAQLEASIKAGKYVPLSEINLDPVVNNSYSIF